VHHRKTQLAGGSWPGSAYRSKKLVGLILGCRKQQYRTPKRRPKPAAKIMLSSITTISAPVLVLRGSCGCGANMTFPIRKKPVLVLVVFADCPVVVCARGDCCGDLCGVAMCALTGVWWSVLVVDVVVVVLEVVLVEVVLDVEVVIVLVVLVVVVLDVVVVLLDVVAEVLVELEQVVLVVNVVVVLLVVVVVLFVTVEVVIDLEDIHTFTKLAWLDPRSGPSNKTTLSSFSLAPKMLPPWYVEPCLSQEATGTHMRPYLKPLHTSRHTTPGHVKLTPPNSTMVSSDSTTLM
jgi:hypothetical protein